MSNKSYEWFKCCVDFVREDTFNLYVFLLSVCAVLNLLFFSWDLPFPVLFGSLLYKIHQENFLKKSENRYVKNAFIVFVVLLCWRLLFLLGFYQVGSFFEKIYFLCFVMIAGISLSFFPLKIYKEYNYKENGKNIKRLLLVSQLATISFLCGLTTLLIFANNFDQISFEVSPRYLIFILIVISLFFKGDYLRQEWLLYYMKPNKTTDESNGEKMTQEDILLCESSLIALMEEESYFLKTNISLNSLSVESNIPKYKLSLYFNQHLRKTFYHYIAEYRIQFAVKSLMAEKTNYTIEALAFSSGFNSVTTFNKYFREFMGCSPKEYQLKIAEV